MQTVHRSFRLPASLDEWLKQHRDETGVPTTVFVRRLIADARSQHQETAVMRPAKRGKTAGSPKPAA